MSRNKPIDRDIKSENSNQSFALSPTLESRIIGPPLPIVNFSIFSHPGHLYSNPLLFVEKKEKNVVFSLTYKY